MISLPIIYWNISFLNISITISPIWPTKKILVEDFVLEIPNDSAEFIAIIYIYAKDKFF